MALATLLVARPVAFSQTANSRDQARVSRQQEHPAAARLRSLSNDVLRINAALQSTAPDRSETLRQAGAHEIEDRAAALRALIRQDPDQALALAFPSRALEDLAAGFPRSAPLLESRGNWRGILEFWIEDNTDGTFQARAKMWTGNETLEIHFAGEPEVADGQILSVNGIRLGNMIAASAKVEADTTLRAMSLRESTTL